MRATSATAPRFVVVVAEHADDRNLDAADQLARKLCRFLGEPVVGEVAAQEQNVGFQRVRPRANSGCSCPRDSLP